MSTPERARRRLLIFALAVAVAFGSLAIVSWWQGRDDLREGSKVVSGGGPALRVTEVATSYRAVFRVENRARELVITTERIWVRRPFQSRIESYAGPPPGTGRPTVRQSVFGVLTSRSPRAEPLNVAAPPSVATGDVRVDPVLQDALDDRTILRRERREVYGRQCQIYRAGGPVFAGDVERYEPAQGNYADFCVDRNGIVVEEYWVYRGRLIQRRVAVELEIDPAIDTSIFRIDVEPTQGAARGVVERLDPEDVDETGLWTLPATPSGFKSLGRYGVVIPQAAVPNVGGQPQGPGPSSTTDVYVRGPDLLVVDQDPSLLAVVENETRPTRKVDIEGLEDAELIIDARMSEVRGISPDGSVVRIFGTLSPDELLGLARRLRPQE